MGRGAERSRPATRTWAAAAWIAAAACTAPEAEPPPIGQRNVERVSGAAQYSFAEDPLSGAAPAADAAVAVPPEGSEAGQQPAQAPVIFSDDPFRDAPLALSAGVAAAARMEEIPAPPPEPVYDAEVVDRNSELGLAVLRARFLAEELGRASSITIPRGPFSFGDVVPLQFDLRNPLGENVELIPPAGGLVLELEWEVQRWLPIGGHESLRRHRSFRLLDQVLLEPDQSHFLRSELPLEMEGDPGALWEIRVDARLRCAGARQGELLLPLHRVEYRASGLFAFPAGWQEIAGQPLEALRRALGSPAPDLDRHVLVATALLQGEDRYRGLDLLLDSLLRPAAPTRALTAISALQWLTQLPLGDHPDDWIRWRESRRLAGTERP